MGAKHLAGLKQKRVRTLILAFDNDRPNAATGIRPDIENTRKPVEMLVNNAELFVYVVDPESYSLHEDLDEFFRVDSSKQAVHAAPITIGRKIPCIFPFLLILMRQKAAPI